MIDHDSWLTSGPGGPDDERPDCTNCGDKGCDECEPVDDEDCTDLDERLDVAYRRGGMGMEAADEF